MTLDYLLRLSDSAFTGPANRARGTVDKLNAGVANVGKGAAGVNSLASSFTGLAAKIGAAFTAYKAFEVGFAGVWKSIRAAADMETTSTAMTVLIGDAQKAADLIGRIKKLGAETPFEFPELATAGKTLLALGERAADVPDTLRRIGDVASGVAAPIGEIAELYGKARTDGTLFAETINQLTGRGIPIIREFANILGKPESEIKKLAEAGKITFPLLDQAFRNMTASGGQFYRMTAEQAGTVNGLLSTLGDSVGELFLAFGQPFNDAFRPLLQDAIGLAGQLKPMVDRMGVAAGSVMATMRNFVMEAEKGSGLAAVLGEKLKEAFALAGEALMIPIGAIGAAMPAIGDAFLAALTPGVMWLSKSMEAAALRMGSVLSEVLADAVASVPGMGGASVSLKGTAFSADVRSRIAAADAEDALGGADQMFALAGSKLGEAMATFRDELKARVDRFSFDLGSGEVMGQMPEDFLGSTGMAGGGSSQAPGLAGALEASTKDNTKAVKDGAAATKELSRALTGKTTSASTETGRTRIVSARDGSTVARGSDQNTDYSGASQFDLLQQKKRLGISAFSGRGWGPQGRVRGSMGGGLDWLHAMNPELARPAAGMDMTKRFSRPNIQSPGTAQVNEKKAAAAAQTAEKIQGGGGDKPRWDLVAQIAANTANLKVIR
jgi:tape measure domain-containing protein